MADNVCVVDLAAGVMPAFANQVYVGRLLNVSTALWKNAAASAPVVLPDGRQDGLIVV